MSRTDRLIALIAVLRDHAVHRADDLARTLGVSVRTIYRDMDRLAASGVPVTGARGTGYRLARVTTLPPLTLTARELDALTLGIAIVSEVTDPDLRRACLTLADKINTALPTSAPEAGEAWKTAFTPFADTLRGATKMPTLRAAISARQKLRIIYASPDGTTTTHRIRPLRMENTGPAWTLTAWCELGAAFAVFRLDLIQSAEALPELFTDEPGKRLSDLTP